MKMLSEKEKIILETLLLYPSIRDTSYHLINDEKYSKIREKYHKENTKRKSEPFSEAALYQTLYRIRQRQKEARIFINMLLPYRNKSLYLNKVLTPREKMKLEDDENI